MVRVVVSSLVISIAALSGCTVAVRTPDGHTLTRGKGFVKGTSEASAVSILGDPDLITRRLHAGIISTGVVTRYYYFDRRYWIWFNAVWGLEGLAPIEESDLPDLERRSRAFKLVKAGTPLDQVIALVGTPDRVEVSPHDAYPLTWVSWAQFERQRTGADPPDLHRAQWHNRDLSVDFHDGKVKEAFPDYDNKAAAPESP